MRLRTLSTFLSLTLATHAAPAAEPDSEPDAPSKRQNTANFSELLQLASEAGIPIPTNDPALLLSIAPLAAQLNSFLPTAPVLSVLETAVPSGFLSNVVHNPGYASSFVQEFEEGPSPSWFLALPTDVQSYLHTYAAGGNIIGVATAAAGVQSIESQASAASVSSSLASETGSASAAGSGANTTLTSGSTANQTASTTGGISAGTTSAGSTSGGSASGSASGTVSSATSSQSTGGVPSARETGALAAGAVAMAGILGLAVAL